MSTVYLAEHKRLHTRWAMKEVRKQQGTRFDFLAESNILKRLQHPMLPRIVDIFEDRDCIYIVEDFVEGITLDGLLKQQKKVDDPGRISLLSGLVKCPECGTGMVTKRINERTIIMAVIIRLFIPMDAGIHVRVKVMSAAAGGRTIRTNWTGL